MDFSTLNPRQQDAVLHTEGPLLIVAGAGSGKTRVLTWRISYLIKEKGVFPGHILALTFTNKAAKEMQSRVEKLMGKSTAGMWIGTFHAICVRMLRRDIDAIGYTRDFVIYDPQDQKTLIKDVLKELRINEDDLPVKRVVGEIGWAKDRMMGPDRYRAAFPGDAEKEELAEVYRRYQEKLKRNNAMDFDDLILKTLELFHQEPEILASWQDRFRYIHVDEYQDTNRSQYELIRLLAKKYGNLCVVGDLDQSIYGWRGADIRNIRDFEKDFSSAKVVKLEQNYRSTKRILEAANSVIEQNMGRRDKTLWTQNEDGRKLYYYQASDDKEEARYVAANIARRVQADDEEYTDFAVLYRTNAQSRVMEDGLRMAKIPYKIVGGLKFYDRKEIKDIMAYLRIVQNPMDAVSFARIVNVPGRHVGDKSVERLMRESNERQESPLATVRTAIAEKWFPAKTTDGLVRFIGAIDPLVDGRDDLKPAEAIEAIISRSGYLADLERENTIESRSRIENIEEFLSVAGEFEINIPEGLLRDFLADMSLVSDQDSLADEDAGVRLMTLHSAKGLEFPVVFMVGMEENLFPMGRALMEDDLEEERRLCYVGITRAERELHMTHAVARYQFGKTLYNKISRFIEEIPDDLFEVPRVKRPISSGGTTSSSWAVPSMASYTQKAVPVENPGDDAVKPGAKVRHGVFGDGVVISLKGSGAQVEVTIAFAQKGIKKLMLGFAPLEILE